jgi:segregation and condensation protein A
VKLEVFEGPLDLLLHLIRINEVDIADIPIAAISDQYLQYLELMRDLDIDVAAEYLLMAATLAQIKSRMLLPAAEEGEGEEGPDPREELARRLAEYAAFKEVAQGLDRRARLGRDVFAGRLEPESLPRKDPTLEVSLFALLEAMRKVLEEIPAEPQAHEVHLERVSVQDRMHHVMDRLRGAPAGTALFEDVMREGPRVRHYVVMTFLAILELTRLQEVRIFQNADDAGCPVGPIRIRLITLDDPAPA